LNQDFEIIGEDLIRLIKQGKKRAFQKLYEYYAPRLYKFAMTYLKNEADAEELVQTVFVKIWEKRESLDHSKNIKSFIYKISINTIYDFVRKRNIERAFIDFAKNNYNTEDNNTWHSVIFNEMLENLNSLVSLLPEQQRKIFQLSKEQGLSSDEIAKELNLSKRTVENHLYRALKYLKDNFAKDSLISMLFYYILLG
jgi:RNA polymerase sigma-70 factor (ECF subfamily)